MTTTERAESPAATIVAAFARIGSERMRGLPFINPALRVEAIGFRIVNDAWIGVVVTPWSMNLLSLPVRERVVDDRPVGTLVRLRFPSGWYDFVSGATDGIGAHLSCSLYSPVLEFETQADARAVAERILEQLLDAGDRMVDACDVPSTSTADRGAAPRADRRAFLGLSRRAGT